MLYHCFNGEISDVQAQKTLTFRTINISCTFYERHFPDRETCLMPEVSFINECHKDHCDLWAFGGNVILDMDMSSFFFNQACITWIYIHITVDEEHFMHTH